ncbi:MAG: serpin family protein, partial [Okeania sp. SIO4D6]|nr:serpin family protein [Okeania sp. SIO4D6]
INQKIYKSKVKKINLKNPKTQKIINNWEKAKTKGKIEKIFKNSNPRMSWCY